MTTSEALAERRDREQFARTRMGIIGVLVTAMVVIAAMNMDRLPFLTQVSTYDVLFEDAGGLVSGDEVIVAGVKVGSVERISLGTSGTTPVARVAFRLDDTVDLGQRTRAEIKTETVLGRRNLTLLPAGEGRIKPGETIALASTVSPYSLSDALDDATKTLTDTNTEQLSESLKVVTETFSHTPKQVRGAVDGISRLSKAMADRDEALDELLGKAKDVSAVIGKRGDQIATLLQNANALLGELQLRRDALREIITGTRDVAAELTGFVKDNNDQLKPVLDSFNRVMDILNDNEKNFSEAIDRLGPYANTLGEAVSSGPYFSSLVGIPTFGDYTGTFLKVLQRKFPEAAEYFIKYSGFPLLPNNWMQGPSTDSPDVSRPKPKNQYPQPQTTQPQSGGQR